MEFAGKSPFPDSPKTNPPLGIKSIFEAANVEIANMSDDFGRESLGIFDVNDPNFAKESFSFLIDDLGRESLGIMNLSNLDIGRPSLGITYDFKVPEAPNTKKSFNFVTKNERLLETQKASNCDFDFLNSSIEKSVNNVPEVFITSPKNNSLNSLLNTAFVNNRLPSVSSSISSMYPSFNSNSLGSPCLSRILSGSMSSNPIDIMNDAFGNTTDFWERLRICVRPSALSACSPLDRKLDVLYPHRRISSLPSTLESKRLDFDENYPNPKNLTLDAEVDKDDDNFNDSVFIESKHLAERIADGSFYERDDDMLDSLTEADVLITSDDDDEPSTKCETQDVFKTVDKLFISSNNTNKEHLNLVVNSDEKLNSTPNSNKSDKSNNSKSKEAMDIINTLSEILNNTHNNDEQKNEGQHLLSNLAGILLSNTASPDYHLAVDDSGHSSIESDPALKPEEDEVYEVLDLRKKSISQSSDNRTEPEICEPLDLSQKSKSASDKNFLSPKILPPKYKNQHKSLLNAHVNRSLASNCSVSSNESKNSTDSNFKPRKIEKPALKKGPMRAVIPVNNMARRNGTTLKVTPKSESKKISGKLNKTSTPISEPMKPMAQSTPENARSIPCPSPVARPNTSLYSGPKMVKSKLSYSGSNLPVNKSFENKNKANSLLRRGSSGELKRHQNIAKPLVRSHSVGEKSNFSIKQNSRTSCSNSKTNLNSSILKENSTKILRKPSFLKKFGKENVH